MEDFIRAVMSTPSASEAAKLLGISRQAVSKRVQLYREKGVRGLPAYDTEVDTVEVQKLVDKHKRSR